MQVVILGYVAYFHNNTFGSCLCGLFLFAVFYSKIWQHWVKKYLIPCGLFPNFCNVVVTTWIFQELIWLLNAVVTSVNYWTGLSTKRWTEFSCLIEFSFISFNQLSHVIFLKFQEESFDIWVHTETQNLLSIKSHCCLGETIGVICSENHYNTILYVLDFGCVK